MKKILKGMLLVLAAAALLGLAGCGKKGPMQKAGESVDKAAEATGDAVKESADKTGDALENK